MSEVIRCNPLTLSVSRLVTVMRTVWEERYFSVVMQLKALTALTVAAEEDSTSWGSYKVSYLIFPRSSALLVHRPQGHIKEQPSKKPFTDRHGSWSDWSATITGVSQQSVRETDKLNSRVSLSGFTFPDSPSAHTFVLTLGPSNKRTTNNFLPWWERVFYSRSVISPINSCYGYN